MFSFNIITLNIFIWILYLQEHGILVFIRYCSSTKRHRRDFETWQNTIMLVYEDLRNLLQIWNSCALTNPYNFVTVS